jgi:hypothetical protein
LFCAKYGGYAGLSVPIVSLPAVLSFRVSFAQASADGLGATLGATEADAATEGAVDGAMDGALLDDGDAPVEQAPTTTVASRRAMTDGTRRMNDLD